MAALRTKNAALEDRIRVREREVNILKNVLQQYETDGVIDEGTLVEVMKMVVE